MAYRVPGSRESISRILGIPFCSLLSLLLFLPDTQHSIGKGTSKSRDIDRVRTGKSWFALLLTSFIFALLSHTTQLGTALRGMGEIVTGRRPSSPPPFGFRVVERSFFFQLFGRKKGNFRMGWEGPNA